MDKCESLHGEDIVSDPCADVEDAVMSKILNEVLLGAVSTMSQKRIELIHQMFLDASGRCSYAVNAFCLFLLPEPFSRRIL